MGIAPSPKLSEKFSPTFETTRPSEPSPVKGVLRHEEGTANAPFIQPDFQRGRVTDTTGTGDPQGRQTVETFYKRAPDTMRERAHLGSASWMESPSVLSEFKDGLDDGEKGTAVGGWTRSFNPGTYQKRPSAARISN